jgi:hypothetical protein
LTSMPINGVGAVQAYQSANFVQVLVHYGYD